MIQIIDYDSIRSRLPRSVARNPRAHRPNASNETVEKQCKNVVRYLYRHHDEFRREMTKMAHWDLEGRPTQLTHLHFPRTVKGPVNYEYQSRFVEVTMSDDDIRIRTWIPVPDIAEKTFRYIDLLKGLSKTADKYDRHDGVLLIRLAKAMKAIPGNMPDEIKKLNTGAKRGFHVKQVATVVDPVLSMDEKYSFVWWAKKRQALRTPDAGGGNNNNDNNGGGGGRYTPSVNRYAHNANANQSPRQENNPQPRGLLALLRQPGAQPAANRQTELQAAANRQTELQAAANRQTELNRRAAAELNRRARVTQARKDRRDKLNERRKVSFFNTVNDSEPNAINESLSTLVPESTPGDKGVFKTKAALVRKQVTLPVGITLTDFLGQGQHGMAFACNYRGIKNLVIKIQVVPWTTEEKKRVAESSFFNELYAQTYFRQIGLPTPRVYAWAFNKSRSDDNNAGKTVVSFIIMDRVEFVLKDVFKRNVFSDATVNNVLMKRLQKMISIMREHGIAHGDFHFGNIGFVRDGNKMRMVLLDFERAMIFEPGELPVDSTNLLRDDQVRKAFIKHIDVMYVWRQSVLPVPKPRIGRDPTKEMAFEYQRDGLRRFNKALIDGNFEPSKLLNPDLMKTPPFTEKFSKETAKKFGTEQSHIVLLSADPSKPDISKVQEYNKQPLFDHIEAILTEVFIHGQLRFLDPDFQSEMAKAFRRKLTTNINAKKLDIL